MPGRGEWDDSHSGGGAGGHGAGWDRSSRAEEDSRKVFVGNLPGDIRDDELRQIFATYGTVVDVKIIDGTTSKCAFVTYDNESAAKTSIQVLHNVYKFRLDAEKPIRVEETRKGGGGGGPAPGGGGPGAPGWEGGHSQGGEHGGGGAGGGKMQVFVGNLPMDIREDEVRQIFGTYGQVLEVKIIDGKPPGFFKCAFVMYDNESAAKTAIQLLHNVYKFRPEADKPIRVEETKRSGGGPPPRDDFSRSSGGNWGGGGGGGWSSGGGGGGHSGPEQHEGGKTQVFVGNLPMDIHEDEVRMIFGTYGQVTDVKIIDGKPPGFFKCAFVSYDAEAGARTSIQVLHEVYKFRPEAEKPIRVEFTRTQSRAGGGDWGKGGGGGQNWPAVQGGGGKGGYGGGGQQQDQWGGGGGGGGGNQWSGGQQGGQGGGFNNQGSYGSRNDGGERKGGYGKGGDFNRPPGPKLHIGNLPQDITRDALMMVFGTYGRIVDVHIMQRPDYAQAAAFVTYETEADSRKCVAAMEQGYEIRPGQGNINVTYAREQKPGGKGAFNRSQPY